MYNDESAGVGARDGFADGAGGFSDPVAED